MNFIFSAIEQTTNNPNSIKIWIAVIGLLGILLPILLNHYFDLIKIRKQYKQDKNLFEKQKTELKTVKKENREYEIKISLFDRIMDITAINMIKESVNRMFNQTKADRFLILIAINGKHDFNVVSVIFEQHKSSLGEYNAIGRYHNINIDNCYRNILKRSEHEDYVLFDTATEKNCLLKDFYDIEDIKHSLIKHLVRKPIDEDNDFLVFSSVATHDDNEFTNLEKTILKTEYESHIIENINKVLD